MKRHGVFDPRFIQHVQPTVNSLSVARVKVSRAASSRPDWEPGVGNVNDPFQQIWEGPGRVQPNIDWRARTRDFQGEWDATMAVRIDLPMGVNEFGATFVDGVLIAYNTDPAFAFGDIVEVITIAGPGQETLLGKKYTVRTALPSTTMWQHNLLCDVGTSLHG
jgi:hypothetical protein